MKLLPIVLAAFVLVGASHSQPVIFDFLKNINAGIREFATDAGGHAQETLDGIGRIADGLADKVNELSKGAINAGVDVGKGAVAGAQNFALSVLDSFQNATISFNNAIKSQINNFGSSVMTKALNEVHDRLQDIETRIGNLLAVARTAMAEGGKAVENILKEQQDDLQKWANSLTAELEGLDEDKKTEATELITAFVEDSEIRLQNCTNGVLADIQKLYNASNALIQQYSPIMDELIAKVDGCRTSPKDFRTTVVCAREIRQKLEPLRFLPGKLNDLREKFDRVKIPDVQKLECLPIVIASIQAERRRVEEDVEEIMQS